MALFNSKKALFLTRFRLLIVTSLALTWWLAHVSSRYKAAVEAEFSTRIEQARNKIPNVMLDWTADDRAVSPYNASKLALLIEPRPVPHLVPLIMHMISVAPPDWRFLFIGSAWSVYAVQRAPAIKHQQAVGKLTVLKLPKPWAIDRPEDVFRILTDNRFYDEFMPGVEWILKYEHDSILCANAPRSLDEWLDWSWAGAPRTAEDRLSVSGGLTLRRVSAMKRVLAFQNRHNDSEPEDEWFSKRLSSMPSEKIASREDSPFAGQNVFVDRPMGFHIPGGGSGLDQNIWEDPDMRDGIFTYCPELSMIMDMKLERERCPDDNHHGGRLSEDYFAQPALRFETQQRTETTASKLRLPPRPPLPPQARAESSTTGSQAT
ncbi:hypothetical protein HIM_07701 [Hirsutella minnesotensis 3608]|uniref:DUF5672 domain-containing protein n=1 Tax=Hirsutella minnesotensis 3608 TaxID=1043627 RepID=A0A0F7ZTD8_9HYPO|nr:hypothetical protein HIM_07701 [Hirsutella minnesotensis 3608]